MQNITFSIVSLILLGFFTNGIAAWGASGHQIVAKLAQDRLSETAWAWVHAIQNSPNATLVSIATEADDYAYSRNGEWSQPLHYANIIFGEAEFDLAIDCGIEMDFQCVVGAIYNYTMILQAMVLKDDANPDAYLSGTPMDGNDTYVPEPTPLAFLTHFVGDVHQPLHVSYGCDQGGNLVNTSNTWANLPPCDNPPCHDQAVDIQYFNLHKTWDSVMIDTYCGGDWELFADELQDIIDKNQEIVIQAEADMDAVDWADESFRWVLETVYDFSPHEDTSLRGKELDIEPFGYPDPGTCPLSNEIYELPVEYYHRNLKVVKLRLMEAGIRLGKRLNGLFVNSPPQ